MRLQAALIYLVAVPHIFIYKWPIHIVILYHHFGALSMAAAAAAAINPKKPSHKCHCDYWVTDWLHEYWGTMEITYTQEVIESSVSSPRYCVSACGRNRKLGTHLTNHFFVLYRQNRVWLWWMSHRKWKYGLNGLHCPVQHFRPIIPFPVWHPP